MGQTQVMLQCCAGPRWLSQWVGQTQVMLECCAGAEKKKRVNRRWLSQSVGGSDTDSNHVYQSSYHYAYSELDQTRIVKAVQLDLSWLSYVYIRHRRVLYKTKTNQRRTLSTLKPIAFACGLSVDKVRLPAASDPRVVYEMKPHIIYAPTTRICEWFERRQCAASFRTQLYKLFFLD